MTLLETLVVVAIVALITALGYPAVHPAGSAAQLRSQSRALVADLRRARSAALHLDRPVTLTADADGGGWRWDGGAERTDAALRLSADRAIIFYPDGSANGGGFDLRTRTRAVHLDVDRATGAVAFAAPR